MKRTMIYIPEQTHQGLRKLAFEANTSIAELIRQAIDIVYGEDVNGYKLAFNQPSKAVKNCMSCGMPMTKLEDFGGGNPANMYCAHCSNPDGTLKSYEEVFKGMVSFMITSQDMNKETAEGAAKEYMSKMPAWSGE